MLVARVNIAPLLGRFDRMRRSDQRKVFSAARPLLRADLRRHAKDQSDESGRWPKRASTTIDRLSRGNKRGGRGRLLKRLPSANKITSGPDFVKGTSLVKWSRAHNEGARTNHGGRLARRHYMYPSKDLIRQIKRMIVVSLVRDVWRRI